jgi:peroxiredoxin Q/BCP
MTLRLHAGDCEFEARLPALSKKKAVVLGVSILDEKSKAKFATKHGITFPAARRCRHEVAEKYGVWQEKSRYGRTYMGIVRTTYLIGPDGKVEQRWDNVKVDGHAEAVAKAID